MALASVFAVRNAAEAALDSPQSTWKLEPPPQKRRLDWN